MRLPLSLSELLVGPLGMFKSGLRRNDVLDIKKQYALLLEVEEDSFIFKNSTGIVETGKEQGRRKGGWGGER